MTYPNQGRAAADGLEQAEQRVARLRRLANTPSARYGPDLSDRLIELIEAGRDEEAERADLADAIVYLREAADATPADHARCVARGPGRGG